VPVVDLSAPIQQSPPELPELLRTDLRFADHAQGARDIEGLLGVPARLLRDGEGWAVEEFTRFGTHNSTHGREQLSLGLKAMRVLGIPPRAGPAAEPGTEAGRVPSPPQDRKRS